MRPGLVAVGTAFIAVAAALTATFYGLPPPPQVHVVTTDVPPVDTAPNGTLSVLLAGTNVTSSTGSFDLSWESSGVVNAELYDMSGCSSPSLNCSQSLLVAQWFQSSYGVYNSSGTVHYPFLLSWTDQAPRVVALWASSVSRQDSAGSFPIMEVFMVDLAVFTLATTGMLAMFLGLFLRGGFRDSPGLPPLLAAEERIRRGEVTAPRTGSRSAATGRPPREPLSPDR